MQLSINIEDNDRHKLLQKLKDIYDELETGKNTGFDDNSNYFLEADDEFGAVVRI